MAAQVGSDRPSSMMHLFFNCLAASAGGGVTYVRNLIPHLACRTDLHATVALSPALRNEFGSFSNLSFVEMETSKNTGKRFLQEQFYLPRLIRRSGADVLISTGNFAVRNSPVPQILLSGNSLYTSEDFSRDVRSRGDYGLWLDTRIKGFFAGPIARSHPAMPSLTNCAAGPTETLWQFIMVLTARFSFVI